MGTKANPGKFDCYDRALPDEPMFTLLGRDPDFQRLVEEWAIRRQHDINCGERPLTDLDVVAEAFKCAKDGAMWRADNHGKWRIPKGTRGDEH